MKVLLKNLHLENFKGVKDKEYKFNDFTKICGANGLGKTTIVDAWMWLLVDKNYELRSNPNIRPIGVEECIPTVTATLDVDGKEITIAKMQKCKKGKPDDNGICKITLTNSYEVNSVPKTERDFKAYLEELGVDFETLLVCIHPSAFMSMKPADMRKIIFKMASEKSDLDIAKMSADTTDVAKLFEQYTFEEVEAMNKASKKKASEQVEAIPNQIIGMENAKVDIDVAERELQKNLIIEKISELKKKSNTSDNGIGELEYEEMQLQFTLSGICQTMNNELSVKRNEIDRKLNDMMYQLKNIARDIADTQTQITCAEHTIADAKKQKEQAGVEYLAKKKEVFDDSKWIFDDSSTVCSLCGQTLPKDKIDEIRDEFETNKANARCIFDRDKTASLKSIEERGFHYKDTIETSTKNNEERIKKMVELKTQETELQKSVKELQESISSIPSFADYSTNEEWVKTNARREEVLAQIEKLKSNTVAQDDSENEINKLELDLEMVKDLIAQANNNVRIDEQIEELQKRQREYEQSKADAEKILYQLSLVGKKKNELLVDDINKHFGIVKWTLFEFQKNGEYKEVCIPTVDGKRFGESTNTGREIIAKLDICYSLQKFFNTYYPVFLDSAESINNWNIPKNDDTQLITLNVTESKELEVK